MAEPKWISTSALLPSDGQSVLVRYSTESRRAAIFWRHPVARWETGVTVYQIEHFDQWAPVSPDASN